jgi:hypothetical protein
MVGVRASAGGATCDLSGGPPRLVSSSQHAARSGAQQVVEGKPSRSAWVSPRSRSTQVIPTFGASCPVSSSQRAARSGAHLLPRATSNPRTGTQTGPRCRSRPCRQRSPCPRSAALRHRSVVDHQRPSGQGVSRGTGPMPESTVAGKEGGG